MSQPIEIEFAVKIEVDGRNGYIVVGRNPAVGTDDESQLMALLRSQPDTRNVFTFDQFLNNVATSNSDVKSLVIKAYHEVFEKVKMERARVTQKINRGFSPRGSILTKLIATKLIWTGKS